MLLKSLVVCLVLANAGYFLWARGIGQPAEPAPEMQIPTLKLASEAAETPRPAATANPAAANPAAANPAAAVDNPAGDAGTLARGASPVADAVVAAPPPQRCITVGPFRDVSEAAHAATTLRGGGYDPRQRVADGDVWAGVWVYLPLPSSRAAGDQMLGKLKAAGFDDALEMPGPGDTSVISLGLYSELKRAQARVAQAQALGFNPAIADRKRTGNVYWIDIDLKPTDTAFNPADLPEAGRIMRLEVTGCPPMSGASP